MAHRNPVVRDTGTPSARTPGVLAGLSVLLVVVALLAPPELGRGLAVAGLVGLFLVRLAAFRPRGAWPVPPRPHGTVLDRRRRARRITDVSSAAEGIPGTVVRWSRVPAWRRAAVPAGRFQEPSDT